MPRRSRGSSGSRPPAPARAPLRNPPQPVAHAPSPAPAPVQGGSGSMMGGFGAAVADGLAFGTGSAVAHRAVDAVMGPRVIHHETVASPATAGAAAASTPNSSSLGDACGGQYKAFQDCINSYGSDVSKCQFYMDMLNECRRSSGAILGA